jgi:hypothetical protein
MAISFLWSKKEEEIRDVVNNANSMAEAIKLLGDKNKGAKRDTFIKICNFYKIDLTELRRKGLRTGFKKGQKKTKKKNMKRLYLKRELLKIQI